MKLIIDIKVADLKRAIHFYTNSLGLTCRREEKEWAALLVGDAEIHLYLQGGVTGHVEFYVENVEEDVRKLTARGIRFISGKDKPHAICVDSTNITQFPWGKTAFFTDTEGNELAIVQDN